MVSTQRRQEVGKGPVFPSLQFVFAATARTFDTLSGNPGTCEPNHRRWNSDHVVQLDIVGLAVPGTTTSCINGVINPSCSPCSSGWPGAEPQTLQRTVGARWSAVVLTDGVEVLLELVVSADLVGASSLARLTFFDAAKLGWTLGTPAGILTPGARLCPFACNVP